MELLLWVGLFTAVTAETPACPLFTCDPLTASVCANITDVQDLQVVLNSNGCAGHLGCNLDEIEYVLTQGIQTEFPCTYYAPQNFVFSSELRQCPARNSQKDLKSGSHPKTCLSVQDCELLDGSFAQCFCGLKRYKVCQPDVSDSIYDTFWKLCTEESNMITEKMDYLWGYYYWSYPILVSAPDCADDILVQLWMTVPVCASFLSSTLLYVVLS